MEEALAYRIPDGAQRVSLGRTKFLEEVAAGRIRTVRVGRRVLVTEQELRRYLDALASDGENATA